MTDIVFNPFTGELDFTGLKGDPGVGITNIVYNLDGTLTITYGDGSTVTTGNLQGLPGEDGREIELQASATHIQWRYVGELVRTDLIALEDLKGDTGNGIDNVALISTVGKVKTYRMTFTDATTFDYIVTDGADGTGVGDFMADGSVPMTGDLNLNGNDLNNTNSVQFDTTPVVGAYSQGRTYRDTKYKTLSLELGDGVTLQLGQESHIRVVNKTLATIPNGSVVYINGIFDDMPTISKAQGNSITTSHIIGVATQDILNDGEGFITAFGSVSDLNTSTFTLGSPIYLSAATAGAFTDVAPTTPNISIQIGVVEKIGTTDGKIFIDIGVPISTDISLACGCDGVSPSVNAVKTYVDQRRIDVNRYGFVPGQTNLTFDGINTVTVTPISATRSYYRAGLKYTITGAKSVVIPGVPLTTGIYYIYIDGTDGTLQYSSTPRTLNDTKVPVATLYFNNTLTPKYMFACERHTCLIDRRIHMYNHYTIGTRYASGGNLTGYTLNTATDAGNTFGIDVSNIFDEDLYLTLSTLTDTNGTTANYFVPYRTAVGTWVRTASDMPFVYTGATAPYTYLQYDNAGTMTASVNNRRVNYYLVETNGRDGTEVTNGTSTSASRFCIIPGRGEFTSAALAYAEQFSSFDMAGFPLVEGVAVWQITYNTSGVANSVKGRCRIDRVQKISSNIISSATSTTAIHDGLSGLNLAQTGVTYGHIDDQAQTIAGAKTFSSDVVVPAEAYGIGWNESNEVPTKNDIYDQIELLPTKVQTITNKTFDDEIRGKQIATPANPSAGYNKLYFKTDDKLYRLTSGGLEVEVGSGAGGLTKDLRLSLTGAYTSATTFTFSGTTAERKMIERSIFTCTNSAGTTRRIGYVKSTSGDAGTITVTVVTNTDLASGDKDFKITPHRKIDDYKNLITIPGEVIADTSNPQGMRYSPKDLSYILPVNSLVKRAALGTGAACSRNIYTESLSDISTGTFVRNYNIGGQENNIYEVIFKPDGLAFFIVGGTNNTIYQYTLTTPWDTSTASYASKSFSVATQSNGTTGMVFNNDGTKCYVINNNSSIAYQYTLTTPWDISTASYDSKSFNFSTQAPFGLKIQISANGSKLYMFNGGTIYQYTLTTPWDISTASYDSITKTSMSGSALFVDGDGKKLRLINGQTLTQYSITTAYNISTATTDSKTVTITSDTSNYGVFFRPDGAGFFVAANNNDYVSTRATTAINETAIFSSAQDMSIFKYYDNRRPTTNEVSPQRNISLRIISSVGATNKASDFQAELYIIPQSLFTAF